MAISTDKRNEKNNMAHRINEIIKQSSNTNAPTIVIVNKPKFNKRGSWKFLKMELLKHTISPLKSAFIPVLKYFLRKPY